MSFSNGIRIILWIVVVIIKDVTGRITDPPLNAAAEVGGQAIFNCTSDLTVQNWILSKTREEVDGNMPTVQTIVAGCVVQPAFTTNYEVDRPGGSNNKCNLIVKATTMQQAGIYTCSDSQTGPSSILTVIDRDASIAVNKQLETVEGDEVRMSYTVRYNTSTASTKTPTIRPLLSWKDSNGNNVTTSASAATTSPITSSISVIAGRQDIRPYTCQISYEIIWPSTSVGLTFANNTPTSVSNPSPSSTIDVLYGPTTPNITHVIRIYQATDGTTCTVTTLTCTSTSNPSANYTWKDVTNGNQLGIGVTGNVFDWAEDNRRYECTAFNIIRNNRRSSSAVYTVNVTSTQPCVSVKSNDIRVCSDDGRCDNNASSRSCSNSSRIIYLTCNISNVYPKPTQFQWKDDVSGSIVSNTSSYNATINGDYTLLVYNEINQQTKTAAEANVSVTDCCAGWVLPVSFVFPWIGVCLIVTIIFIVCYATLATPFRAKMINRFNWLQYMMPCVKNPRVEPEIPQGNVESPAKISENEPAREKPKHKKRKKERILTDKPDSSATKHPNSDKTKPSTAKRPLPPKPGKLDPVNNTQQTKSPTSKGSTTSASEIKTIVNGKDICERIPSPRWKTFLFMSLLVLVSVTCGVVFFPILITIAYCCPKEEAANKFKGKPMYMIPLIVLMWFGVAALMFPLTFVLVYFITCDQMTYRYVVTR